ncbi:hypothetical protein DACRYDRAFT_77926 [Dacryopinax primogenitus]|uniref:Probable 26S proteasome regulatory subunit p27 n=1 Tax=Dacryopinax primogenitus (strain DJM 731) TaxID=1858805 RepID=M5GAS3_DACPD|nr:uncharacterized protein DACRYDRAFT_77926 [Dacryopinax primogenitus]EJU03072.1 hypothetical protein DACRYDRAFT_77926 [Dacryopinax primogenitus]
MELPSPTSPALARQAEASSSSGSVIAEGARQHALVLVKQQEALETEMELHFTTLRANRSTMHTPLLTPDGFPRDDIDVFAVRTARVRIIELRNDVEKVREDIKRALEGMWEPVLAARAAAPKESTPQMNGTDVQAPFARVDAIMPQSPASEAGLQKDDLLLSFGLLSTLSHPSLKQDLSPLAGATQQHQDRNMIVMILRGAERKTLILQPRTGWGGRGMLGCHIVPYRA